MSLKVSAVAALLSLSFVVASPVSAQERDIHTRSTVEVPSPLTDARTIQKAYKSLQIAAKRACDSGLGRDLAARASDQVCAADALDRAVRDSNVPGLMAYHDGKTVNAPVYAENADTASRSATSR